MRMVVGAAILDDAVNPTEILVARRTKPEHLAGCWEFPGGKVEAGETEPEALARELREELDIESHVLQKLNAPSGGWPLNNGMTMQVYATVITDGAPRICADHDKIAWVSLDEQLKELGWIPANAPIVDALLAFTRSIKK